MNTPIWTPTRDRIETSNMVAFMTLLGHRANAALRDYADLYAFSIAQPSIFWSAVWDFCGVIGQRFDGIVDDVDKMPGARWFPGATLNFAENSLRRRDVADAIVALSETGAVRRVSFAQLYAEVSRAEQALRSSGVHPGDRVAGYLPNIPEAVIAMLATAAIGAIWCVCSTDYGVEATLDRLGQVDPKVLFIADGYHYNGKVFDLAGKGLQVAARLPSVVLVVVVSNLGQGAQISDVPNVLSWNEFSGHYESGTIDFQRFAFDHPALILFSSGTTGAPKCIVHCAGGALLQNLKDLKLQFDVKRDDRVFWWTSTGWVAWNMMLFALACEATVVLYDGSPFYPSLSFLFDVAERERITFLRLTPKYVETVAKAGFKPALSHDVSSLKCITVGGAPFGASGYDYVYEHIKPDVHLASPAGGTDPLGAFVAGSPISPVWRGEMQCRGLGLKIEILDEQAQAVIATPGELVCTLAFPSMPLGFWGDPDGKRFHATYFSTFPNVWRQGDWAEITPRGGVIIYGRSDSTLKVRGVRIGTAEIYRQVEQIRHVVDSVVVDHELGSDSEIILFVQLATPLTLEASLVAAINAQISTGASPRYVPDRIVQVADIPRTATGKVSEPAVRAALHGLEVRNRHALSNPEALALFAPQRVFGDGAV
jgi:acetoacetyl-CoA synthetase